MRKGHMLSFLSIYL